MNLQRVSNSIVTRLLLIGVIIVVVGTILRFSIVLADLAAGDARNAACVVAEKCIEAMARPFAVRDTICALGVSIGVVAGDETCSAHDLLRAADQAMYLAKEAGRGCYMIAGEVQLATHDSETVVSEMRKG